jgi:D-glycero-alpha-D-manno-heptose-7-phosphate kinase
LWISSAPLRISLAGGGTDLPAYASRFGGAVLGVTTSLRTTVIGNLGGGRTAIRACLDTCMDAQQPHELSNPFAREAMRAYWDGRPMTLVSTSDVRGGTGVGSSAAFCVALIAGLTGARLTAAQLAEAAAAIEIDAMNRPVGKQDHYLSALGGFQFLRFGKGGGVQSEQITPDTDVVRRLESELMLFSTGITRHASTVLEAQHSRLTAGDTDTEASLHEIKELTVLVRDALANGDTEQIGTALGLHWEAKKKLSTRVTLPEIDRAYEDAVAAGATGGKVLGAGGGGYLLMHVNDTARSDVREVFAKHDMPEQSFRLDDRGHEITWIQDGH